MWEDMFGGNILRQFKDSCSEWKLKQEIYLGCMVTKVFVSLQYPGVEKRVTVNPQTQNLLEPIYVQVSQ